MSERKISKKSLENLKISNQESNRITKESLEISLLQLLEKKELTKITISELVERAGVSRAAFYRNYDSKEEILQEIFQRTVQKITDKLEQFNMRTELYQVWLFLFKEVKKEARILSLAVDYNLEKLLTSAVFDFLATFLIHWRDIEAGEITEHFTTESLQNTRKKYRTEYRELKIRRWAADQHVNGNRIVEAFDLFLPGHTLIDNPQLSEIVRAIEDEEDISFFGASEFEEALMEFFNSL